jgi:hypothetical protein
VTDLKVLRESCEDSTSHHCVITGIMFLLGSFVGQEGVSLRCVKLELNMIVKLLAGSALIVQMGQLRLVKFTTFSAEYLSVVDLREKLGNFNLPLLESSGKWLDELVEEEA